MSRKKTIIGIVSLLLTVIGAFLLFPKTDVEQTVIIKKGDLVEAAYAVGTVKSDQVYNLKVGVGTRVIERHVRLGDEVTKGDLLMTLEGFPVFRAPFTGTITAMNYEAGELVTAQSVILTLTNMKSLRLELSLDERTISSIKKEQIARINFEGSRDKLFTGKVRSIYANEGEFVVIVDADLSLATLYPGMTADVAIQVGLHEQKLLIPMGAVDQSDTLMVVRQGHPLAVKVELGANDGEYVVIKSGDVTEGDKVVVRQKRKPASGPPI